MQLTTRNEFSEDIDLKMSVLGDVKAPPCPLGGFFGAWIPSELWTLFLVSNVFTCVMMKGWSISFLRRTELEGAWMAHETLRTMAKVTGRSSQKSGMPHSRMHCRIPNLCTQWLLSTLSGQTPSLFGLSTPVPKHPSKRASTMSIPAALPRELRHHRPSSHASALGERWSSSLYGLVTSHDNSSQALVACQHFPTQIVMISWALNLNAKKVDFSLWSYAVSDAQPKI